MVAGDKVFLPNPERKELDEEQINKWEKFWRCLKKLEELLSVSFTPSADLTQEDALFMEQLEKSLINSDTVSWQHPFDHLHIQGINMKSGKIEDLIGKGKIEFGFTEGPIDASLMGADFQLYSETWMSGFIITGVEWDDETHTSAEIYIADENNEKWILTRKFITENEYMKRKSKTNLNQK